MALGSTQPGMFPGGKGGRCIGLTTLSPSCADCLEIGEPQPLEPSGPVQACNGIALPLHKFTKNRKGTSKLYVLAPKVSSTLRTHSSGVTCEPDCNVALCAQHTELIHIVVFVGKTAVIMPKLLGTTTKFCGQSDQVPRVCAYTHTYALYTENGF
jgi:hypothetical protein